MMSINLFLGISICRAFKLWGGGGLSRMDGCLIVGQPSGFNWNKISVSWVGFWKCKCLGGCLICFCIL